MVINLFRFSFPSIPFESKFTSTWASTIAWLSLLITITSLWIECSVPRGQRRTDINENLSYSISLKVFAWAANLLFLDGILDFYHIIYFTLNWRDLVSCKFLYDDYSILYFINWPCYAKISPVEGKINENLLSTSDRKSQIFVFISNNHKTSSIY